MKISDQVCTREQAQKLRLLGIAQVAYFFHVFRTKPNEFWNIEHLGTAPAGWQSPQDEYAAYTVAELGQMLINFELPIYWKLWAEWCYKEKDQPRGYATEAQARAAKLIYLLESKLTTPEETNKRLNQ